MGGTWQVIPGSEDLAPVACEEVNIAISRVTGCAVGTPCQLGDGRGYDGPPRLEAGYQVFFARVAAQLRGMGLCAGQHRDGAQDGIAVAQALDGRPVGTWDEQHIVAYTTGSVLWCRGTGSGAYKAAYRWVVDGRWPSEPSPSSPPSPAPPGPAPTPKPPTIPQPVVEASSSSVRVGGSVELVCRRRSDHPVTGWWVRPPHGSRISQFSVSGNERSERRTLRILPGCPATTISAYCVVGEYGAGAASRTVRIQVTP